MRKRDEDQAEQGPRQRAQGPVIHALVDQVEASSEHEPGRDGVGGYEPPACGVLGKGERHGAVPRGRRREQRKEKDRSFSRRFHTLYHPRSRPAGTQVSACG